MISYMMEYSNEQFQGLLSEYPMFAASENNPLSPHAEVQAGANVSDLIQAERLSGRLTFFCSICGYTPPGAAYTELNMRPDEAKHGDLLLCSGCERFHRIIVKKFNVIDVSRHQVYKSAAGQRSLIRYLHRDSTHNGLKPVEYISIEQRTDKPFHSSSSWLPLPFLFFIRLRGLVPQSQLDQEPGVDKLPWKCVIPSCSKRFKKESVLLKHISSSYGIPRYECHICKKLQEDDISESSTDKDPVTRSEQIEGHLQRVHGVVTVDRNQSVVEQRRARSAAKNRALRRFSDILNDCMKFAFLYPEAHMMPFYPGFVYEKEVVEVPEIVNELLDADGESVSMDDHVDYSTMDN